MEAASMRKDVIKRFWNIGCDHSAIAEMAAMAHHRLPSVTNAPTRNGLLLHRDAMAQMNMAHTKKGARTLAKAPQTKGRR